MIQGIRVSVCAFSLCVMLFFSSMNAIAGTGSAQSPLHILMLDACLLPKTMDFLKGKYIAVELITSAHPALKSLFTPSICMTHYNHAVGPEGKVVDFHSRFLGKKMDDEPTLKRALNKIVKERGPIDLVLANSSDLATYMSNIARKHLGIAPARWEIENPECFYNKLVMKETLTKNNPAIKTAPFIAFDAPWSDMDHFLQNIPFPLILKKRRSAGSVGMKVIEDRASFNQVYAQVKDKENFLLERFIVGKTLRIQGEKVNDKLAFTIPSFNRTSPLEHYQGGKTRVTTTIDENEISLSRIQSFTEDVLKALKMRTGTYHLEAIYADQDKDLYFMEIAARPGEGNMDDVYRDLHHYDARRAFYFKQFPETYWIKNEYFSLKEVEAELFEEPLSRSKSGGVYAVITYPFKDANRFTFQNIVTNLHPSQLPDYTKTMRTFKGCDFDEGLARADAETLKNGGVRVSRYAFQVCIKAITCRFEGPRDILEEELREWQSHWQFEAQPVYSVLNRMVPREILMAGGL